MTKNQTIEILRLVRSGITNPDELHAKKPFFDADELLYLTKSVEPMLILDGNFVSIHENGYNLLDEADRIDELHHLVSETNKILHAAEEKSDRRYQEKEMPDKIILWASVIGCITGIISLLKSFFC